MELTSEKHIQSEFGLIPEDWNVVSFSEIGESIIGLTYSPKDISGSGKLVHRSSNIQNNSFSYKDNVFVSCLIPEKLILRRGDILICVRNGSRDLIGKSAVIDGISVGETFGAFMSVFRTHSYSPLIYQFVISEIVQKQINASLGATINQITNRTLNEFKIPLPPTLNEQKAIATALCDVDSLINSLDKLIIKKKAIKQGAMQELLTPPQKGGRRLPGFSGDWEEITLGEIGQCIIGLTYSPTNVKDSGTLVLRSSNIQNGRFSSHDNVYVDCEIPVKLKVQENDILVCVRNGSRNLIGKSLKLSKELAGQTWGAFMSVYRSKFNDFVVHLFNSNVIQWQIEENLGATINQITNKTLNSFKVFIPKDVEEQKGIAKKLLDMDLEIESLENKKAKYQEIKQGMMQELLTGKTRLFWN